MRIFQNICMYHIFTYLINCTFLTKLLKAARNKCLFFFLVINQLYINNAPESNTVQSALKLRQNYVSLLSPQNEIHFVCYLFQCDCNFVSFRKCKFQTFPLYFRLKSSNSKYQAGKEEEDMLRQVAGGCINETEATDDDVSAMANKQLPSTRTGKCFNFCVLHLFNCVSKRRLGSREAYNNFPYKLLLTFA